jgi:hypothetical protein
VVVVVPPDCRPGPVVVGDEPRAGAAVVVVVLGAALPDRPSVVVEAPVGGLVEPGVEVDVGLGRVVVTAVVAGGTVVVVVDGAGGTVVCVTAVLSGGYR